MADRPAVRSGRRRGADRSSRRTAVGRREFESAEFECRRDEGIHRALVSAELASEAVVRRLAGDRSASSAYERAMREHFLAKDRVSRLVQAFLDRPRLFEYAARRLAARGRFRDTGGLVICNLLPAERAQDPRVLAQLLAP